MSTPSVGGNIVTPEGRASYPNLLIPRGMKQRDGTMGNLKYSVTILFAPGEEGKFVPGKVDLSEMQAAAKAAAIAKFGEAKLALLREAGKFQSPFRRDAELKGYPKGTIFVNMSSTTKPTVVDARNNILTDEQVKDRIYAGCRIRVQTKAYGYDNITQGVSFGLNNLQFLGDDERIDGRTNAKDAFGAPLAIDVADMDEPETEVIADMAKREFVAPKSKTKGVEDLF